ncbi:MAG: hypothetical protein IPL39_00390 [Opitutaceae bacterium]|nr:hypothetical protein [Opitutaceae bacterium]
MLAMVRAHIRGIVLLALALVGADAVRAEVAGEGAPVAFWRTGWAWTAYTGVLNDPDKADTHNLMIFADYPSFIRREKLYAFSAQKRLGGYRDWVDWEADATLAYHSGSVDYAEGAVLGGFRWLKFPWDRWLDTSLAYFIGASYASKVAAFENVPAHSGRHSSHWLPALKMELEFRLPQESPWSVVFGYHHRSGAWGALADRGTISDFACVGLKLRR